MAAEALKYVIVGGPMKTSKKTWENGPQGLKSTESTTLGITNPAIAVGLPQKKTQITSAAIEH